MRRTPVLVRAAKKIVFAESGCWEWTGRLDRDGYGRLYDGRMVLLAHRIIYQEMVGPVSADLHLDHLCRVRHCVNPDHLEPVTPRENALRGLTVPALNAAKTHCKNGHPFDQGNTYIHAGRRRQCRACNAAAQARRKQRRAA